MALPFLPAYDIGPAFDNMKQRAQSTKLLNLVCEFIIAIFKHDRFIIPYLFVKTYTVVDNSNNNNNCLYYNRCQTATKDNNKLMLRKDWNIMYHIM